MTGHLLNTGKSWAGDLIAAESGVDADKNARLSHEVRIEVKCVSNGRGTHVVALVKRCGRHTRWDGRAGAGNLKVDALEIISYDPG